jgi:hypothetical protein
VLFLTILASVNSLLGLAETFLHGGAIQRQRIDPRPLFVLGHPRTGTTLLHSLLALDHETFGICSTFCAGFPAAFLWVERFKWLFEGVIDSKRPMDNVALSFDTPQACRMAHLRRRLRSPGSMPMSPPCLRLRRRPPHIFWHEQEDELAVNVLSAGTSPYMPLAFMTDEPSFRPYFSFKTATADKRRRWTVSDAGHTSATPRAHLSISAQRDEQISSLRLPNIAGQLPVLAAQTVASRERKVTCHIREAGTGLAQLLLSTFLLHLPPGPSFPRPLFHP